MHAAIEAINKGQVSRYLIKPWRNEELIEILQTSIEFVHLQQAMSEMELRLLRGGQKRIATAVHDELLHEIANPLGAMTMTLLQASEMIDGVIARLEHGGASSLPAIKSDLLELREAHGDAMAAVEQLNALAARMRALPGPAHAPASSDAGRVVDATVRIIRRDIERIATLHVVIDRSPLVRVEASELGQIVLNLILNAAQAIEGSGMQGRAIRLSVDARADMAVVSVADDGPGIDAENLGGSSSRTSRRNRLGPESACRSCARWCGVWVAVSLRTACRAKKPDSKCCCHWPKRPDETTPRSLALLARGAFGLPHSERYDAREHRGVERLAQHAIRSVAGDRAGVVQIGR